VNVNLYNFIMNAMSAVLYISSCPQQVKIFHEILYGNASTVVKQATVKLKFHIFDTVIISKYLSAAETVV